MKANDFLKLVGRMIAAQQNYFKSRLQGDLVQAKQLERDVMTIIKIGKLEPDEPVPTAKQASMFDRMLCGHSYHQLVYDTENKITYCHQCSEEKEKTS